MPRRATPAETTDTIQKGFDGVFTASYEQTDAVIAGKEIVKGSQSGAATVPASLLAKVRALPEVGAAGGAGRCRGHLLKETAALGCVTRASLQHAGCVTICVTAVREPPRVAPHPALGYAAAGLCGAIRTMQLMGAAGFEPATSRV